LASGSFSRRRRFPGWCHRCEPVPAPRARPGCRDNKRSKDKKKQEKEDQQ
jgi:hypothetical protein